MEFGCGNQTELTKQKRKERETRSAPGIDMCCAIAWATSGLQIGAISPAAMISQRNQARLRMKHVCGQATTYIVRVVSRSCVHEDEDCTDRYTQTQNVNSDLTGSAWCERCVRCSCWPAGCSELCNSSILRCDEASDLAPRCTALSRVCPFVEWILDRDQTICLCPRLTPGHDI
jgi:hypothetical protein